MTDKPKTKRRWLQFSLRTLLIVVTVFCVWMGITAKQARDRKQAVEMIRELGGTARYEHQFEYYTQYPEPPGPAWLRRLIGNEYFFRVVAVTLRGPKVNDANLTAITRLTDIRYLDLDRTKITDEGMEHLKELTGLYQLSVVGVQITDEGLEHLEAVTNLGLVNLNGTKVTDEGVKKLQQALPNCKIYH